MARVPRSAAGPRLVSFAAAMVASVAMLRAVAVRREAGTTTNLVPVSGVRGNRLAVDRDRVKRVPPRTRAVTDHDGVLGSRARSVPIVRLSPFVIRIAVHLFRTSRGNRWLLRSSRGLPATTGTV